MLLAPGMVLSRYRVIEQIGEGGMGQVWKATDTTLGRDVALKVLPEALSHDPERLARFEREARLLASLNHPNIAAIYELQSHQGTRFLAMELVPGQDLAVRLAQGPVPPAEALPIARAVAEALESAHERGIIHRDLKPSNIMVFGGDSAHSSMGALQVKVLDFGLAKALEGEAPGESSDARLSHSPTITAMTAAHVILGTAAYMSPEQARGQGADKRSDIWSFGVVLFEMLTGRQLFSGETVSDTLASVLRSDMDFNELPPTTPTRIRTLLRRCLERDRRRRLRDIGEARIVLDEVIANAPDSHLAAALASGEIAAARSAGSEGEARSRRARLPALGLAAALGLALGALLVFGYQKALAPSSSPTSDITKLAVPLRPVEEAPPTLSAVSPDGRAVAYLQGDHILVQDLNAVEPREFHTDAAVQDLFWSPDSRNLGFVSATQLLRLDVATGGIQVVCDMKGGFTGGSGGTWHPDGMIVFSRGSDQGLMEVSSRGGDPRVLAPIDSTREGDFHDPCLLPGSHGVLVVPHERNNRFQQIVLIRGDKRELLLEMKDQVLSTPVYSPTGHILFRRLPTNSGIWAVPFSLSQGKVTGDAFLVAAGGLQPSVAKNGLLAYSEGASGGKMRLVWTDRAGKQLDDMGEQSVVGTATWLAVSPDGGRVAISTGESETDLWVLDGARHTRSRLTFLNGFEVWPSFSPDGRHVVFTHRGASDPSNQSHILLTNADGTGAVDTLGRGNTPSFAPDGKRIVFAQIRDNQWDMAWLSLDDRQAHRMFEGPGDQFDPRVSPDGNYIAYVSNESGTYEIFLRRFPDGEGRWQVSAGGGHYPRWNRRGDRLYYLNADQIMEVDVDLRTAPVLGNPRTLFALPAISLNLPLRWPAAFDVTGDGERFLVYQNASGEKQRSGIMLVQNWFEEFRDRKK
jgi:Tol biopolymer transport system component